MFSPIYKFQFRLRQIVSIPFILVGNAFTLAVWNSISYLYAPLQWLPTMFVSVLVCGICYWVYQMVRPPGSLKLADDIKRDKKIKPGRARVVVKRRGSTPSLTAITRRLPKELQAALREPVNRVPEAIAFEGRLLARRKAEMSEDLREPAEGA